ACLSAASSSPASAAKSRSRSSWPARRSRTSTSRCNAIRIRHNRRQETGVTGGPSFRFQEEHIMRRLFPWLTGALLAAGLASASAEELAVGNYGVSANGMPFGVALHKGYFKEEGLNITGLISSAGGGTSLRNMLAGGG